MLVRENEGCSHEALAHGRKIIFKGTENGGAKVPKMRGDVQGKALDVTSRTPIQLRALHPLNKWKSDFKFCEERVEKTKKLKE